MGMRLDLVAAPIRYRRAPLLVLLVLAVVPTVALAALFAWSDARADSYEAARRAADAAEQLPARPEPSTPTGPPVAAALSSAMFDFRRIPQTVARIADAHQLAVAMEPMLLYINDESCVAVAVDGLAVTSKNADVPVMPASTQKLLTAAVALDALGDDYRFTTSVAAAPPVDGVVDGDIYLIGGGDPLLVSDDYPIDNDRHPETDTTSLDALADQVAAAGITRIQGRVVGDGSRYDDEFVNPAWGDGVAYVDAGPYDALLVNDSRTLGRSSRQRDPNEAAAREFARLLGNRGVRVNNGWSSGVADPDVPVIGSIESAPLSAVVAEMLTTSDNNTAEMLLKEIGVVHDPDGGAGTVAGGLNVVDRTLRGWNVPMDGVRLVDGSGLSPDNRLTCATLMAVLDHSRSTAIPAGLPVAGRTGTLSDEFVGSPMDGRLIAKTGTLNNPPLDAPPPAVKALAGYLSTAPVAPVDGGDATSAATVEFALVQVGPDITTDDNYRALWQALGDRLATYPSGPSTADLGPR